MTILKKLLPIATVATLTASVTPLFTSCGIKTKGDFNREVSQYTPENPYKRETQKHIEIAEFTSRDAVNKIYFDDLKANHQIIYDDIFEDLFGANPKPDNKSKFEFKGNLGLTFKDVQPSDRFTIVKDEESKEELYRIKEYLITFGFYADMTGHVEETELKDPTKKFVVDFNIKGQIELTNIPVVIDYVEYRFLEDKPEWVIYIGDSFGNAETNWSLAGKGKANATLNGVEAGIDLNATYTNNSDTKEFAFIWALLFEALGDVSLRLPYLENVAGPESIR